MPDALPATTLPIYHGLVSAQEYAGLHTPVAWLKKTSTEVHLPVEGCGRAVSHRMVS